jgi:ABC-type glycerol-3-phosphate transport system substrate-binding protein
LLTDRPEALQLMSYLASAEGQALFAPNGFTVANKNVDPEVYDGLAKKTASLLATSKVAPDSSALLPSDLKSDLIENIGAAILAPGSIQTLLDAFQESASAELGG